MTRYTRLGAAALITALAASVGLVAPALAHGRGHHASRRAHAAGSGSGGAGLGVAPAPARANGPRPLSRGVVSRGLASRGVTRVQAPTAGGIAVQPALTGAAVPVASDGAAASLPVHPTVPGLTAQIINGVAFAPASAPLGVQQAIWAGNDIRHKPYIYGGGHGSFRAPGYDCSGSVSYLLHAAGLLDQPMDSSDLLSWGAPGLGAWITVYTNPAHAFVEIAGIRLDTSDEGDPSPSTGSGPRWRPLLQDTSAFTPRHFAAL